LCFCGFFLSRDATSSTKKKKKKKKTLEETFIY
jgi:hypothetical protein